MREKKLTDEEIVKALSHCSGVKPICDENCPAYNLQNEITCQDYMNRLVLDLIHRLQAENEELREKLIDEQFAVDKWMEENAEQKAEIERLTEELDGTISMNEMYIKEAKQNAELQKQVDELKKERENVQKILYELGKCGNDEERYAVWVKLIKYCGVEVE